VSSAPTTALKCLAFPFSDMDRMLKDCTPTPLSYFFPPSRIVSPEAHFLDEMEGIPWEKDLIFRSSSHIWVVFWVQDPMERRNNRKKVKGFDQYIF